MDRAPVNKPLLAACLWLCLSAACAYDRAPPSPQGEADLGQDAPQDRDQAPQDSQDAPQDLPTDQEQDVVADLPPDLPQDLSLDLRGEDLLDVDQSDDLPPEEDLGPAWLQGRSREGLQALYLFDGLSVDQRSIPAETASAPALEILGAAPVRLQGRHGVAFLEAGRLLCPQSEALGLAWQQRGAMTLEFLLQSHSLEQQAAHLLAWADAERSNLALLQQGADLLVELRDAQGEWMQRRLVGALDGSPLHLALTVEGGRLTLYLHGEARLVWELEGALEAWDPALPLWLANGPQPRHRAWLGELHLLALYQRALSPEEIAAHRALGAGPGAPAPGSGPLVEVHAQQTLLLEHPDAPPWEAWTLRRAPPWEDPLEVHFQLHGAARAGEDYLLTDTSPLQFAPGQGEQILLLSTLPDEAQEARESVTLQLLSGEGYRLGAASRGTVQVQDQAQPGTLDGLVGWHQGSALACAQGESVTQWPSSLEQGEVALLQGPAFCQDRGLWMEPEASLTLARPSSQEHRIFLALWLPSDAPPGRLLTLVGDREDRLAALHVQEGGRLELVVRYARGQEQRRDLGPVPRDSWLVLELYISMELLSQLELLLNGESLGELPLSSWISGWEGLHLGQHAQEPGTRFWLRESLQYQRRLGNARREEVRQWLRRP